MEPAPFEPKFGHAFGRTAAGEAVDKIAISAGGLTAHILTWGAAIQNLRLEGHDAPLVLGFETFDPYLAHSAYFGATAGRFANRIAGGRFSLDGVRHEVDRNFLGRHTLHGGSVGFGARNWSVEHVGDDFVSLGLRSPDDEMGFPGALDATCTYRIKAPGTLLIQLSATTDAPTICNLAHHSYFNLDDGGTGTVSEHRLCIEAAAYLPVDGDQIPTGVVQPVDGSPFDFRASRPIGRDGTQFPYDHNFCLTGGRGPLRRAAWAQSARSGVEMEMWTTEPGVQFYAGGLLDVDQAGHGGRRYRPHSGFCLEAQIWPDAPNRPYFPCAVLRPGETYRQETEYRFSRL